MFRRILRTSVSQRLHLDGTLRRRLLRPDRGRMVHPRLHTSDDMRRWYLRG